MPPEHTTRSEDLSEEAEARGQATEDTAGDQSDTDVGSRNGQNLVSFGSPAAEPNGQQPGDASTDTSGSGQLTAMTAADGTQGAGLTPWMLLLAMGGALASLVATSGRWRPSLAVGWPGARWTGSSRAPANDQAAANLAAATAVATRPRSTGEETVSDRDERTARDTRPTRDTRATQDTAATGSEVAEAGIADGAPNHRTGPYAREDEGGAGNLPASAATAPATAPAVGQERPQEPSGRDPVPPLSEGLPSGPWGERAAAICAETGGDRGALHRSAWLLVAREQRLVSEARWMHRTFRSEMRWAAAAQTLMPLGALGAVFVMRGADAATLPSTWIAILLAGVLTLLGARWLLRLPASQPRSLARRYVALQGRIAHAEALAQAVGRAQLHAAAGTPGPRALVSAAVDHPDDPLRAAREPGSTPTEPSSADDDRRWTAGLASAIEAAPTAADAARLLDRAGDILAADRRRSLARLDRLSRARAVGPFAACFVPATALLVVVALA